MVVRFYVACDRVVLYLLVEAQQHSLTALPLTTKQQLQEKTKQQLQEKTKQQLQEKPTTSPPLLLSPSSTHDLDHKPIPSVVHLPN
jgi:hypothetical protein